jgi:hypothetical protein
VRHVGHARSAVDEDQRRLCRCGSPGGVERQPRSVRQVQPLNTCDGIGAYAASARIEPGQADDRRAAQ